MIKAKREARMLSILDNAGVASIHGLSRRLGRVSEVTARLNIARLAAQGLLRRSRGGAARVETARPERPKALLHWSWKAVRRAASRTQTRSCFRRLVAMPRNVSALRPSNAFLSVDGVSARFGPSSADERLAGRRFVEASREV